MYVASLTLLILDFRISTFRQDIERTPFSLTDQEQGQKLVSSDALAATIANLTTLDTLGTLNSFDLCLSKNLHNSMSRWALEMRYYKQFSKLIIIIDAGFVDKSKFLSNHILLSFDTCNTYDTLNAFCWWRCLNQRQNCCWIFTYMLVMDSEVICQKNPDSLHQCGLRDASASKNSEFARLSNFINFFCVNSHCL